jgi:hypothetical protein
MKAADDQDKKDMFVTLNFKKTIYSIQRRTHPDGNT